MKCKVCAKDFKDILRHLKSSKKCQSLYDMQALKKERVMVRLSMKKIANQRHYNENKVQILNEKIKYYEDNKQTIRKKQNMSYKLSRSNVFQRRRFKKCFTRKYAMAYITKQQEHLYHHTKEFCQGETMPQLNHSIEVHNGLCNSCKEMRCIKIIGVNRLVCLNCKKAQCCICKAEVSPDPSLGYRHFSPDSGNSLGFLLGHCPLYSTFPTNPMNESYKTRNSRMNLKECKICEDIKSRYPEYDLFLGTEKDLFPCAKRVEQLYICNLCCTSILFVCQFDLHMRNHTKFGQNVAILALNADTEEEIYRYTKHVNESSFLLIEAELMKTNGVIAVLTVFGKKILEKQNMIEEEDVDFNLGAAILLKPNTNIRKEILKTFWKKRCVLNIVNKCKVLTVQNHFEEPYKRGRSAFEEIFLYREWENNLYERNTAILENRCALMYPNHVYNSNFVYNHLDPYSVMSNHHNNLRFWSYESEVLQYLWNLVKNSDICCCVSKFFCTSSTNLDKCRVGCCRKCSYEKNHDEQIVNDIESEANSCCGSEIEDEEESSSETEEKSSSNSESENEEDEFFKNLSS